MSLYKYRVLEILNPRFLFTSVSPLLPPQSGPSFKSWAKGTSVICVGLGPEFDTLERKRHTYTSDLAGKKVKLAESAIKITRSNSQKFSQGLDGLAGLFQWDLSACYVSMKICLCRCIH